MSTLRGAYQRYRGQQRLSPAVTSASELLLIIRPLPCDPLFQAPMPYKPWTGEPSYTTPALRQHYGKHFALLYIPLTIAHKARHPAGDYRPLKTGLQTLQTIAAYATLCANPICYAVRTVA